MDEHFWINPLHLDIDIIDGSAESDEDPKRRSRSIDSELTEQDMNVFFESVQVANEQIHDLINHMLDVEYADLEPESLDSQEYEFLKVPDDIIVDPSSGLLEIYHYLQRYAAALFHIMKETEVTEDSEYYEKLKEAKYKLVRMLCDVQSALIVSKLTPYDDITYDMLPEVITTKRNYFHGALRDFLIIRDYAKFIQNILSKKDLLSTRP